MTEDNLTIRYNAVKVASVPAFGQLKHTQDGSFRDVFFIRALGVNNHYAEDIKALDQTVPAGHYYRSNSLPVLVQPEDVAFYQKVYDQWRQDRNYMSIRQTAHNEWLKGSMAAACQKLIDVFQTDMPHPNPSILKNFMIKCFFWLDSLPENLFKQECQGENSKLVCSGRMKKHEYLFMYLLTRLGVDVLILLPEGDLQIDHRLKALSVCLEVGQPGATAIPEYIYTAPDEIQSVQQSRSGASWQQPVKSQAAKQQSVNPKPAKPQPGSRPQSEQSHPIRIVLPPRERKRSKVPDGVYPAVNMQRQELSMETLAGFAASVVMISIHDLTGKVIGTGSGIMVGQGGYILTNNHVASGGRFYSVRIEEDEQIYKTDEVIKYNQLMDLAVIRISRRLAPLPVYKGAKPLVRGQAVVAIGSPLGLFNTVSNGIISGFRQLNDVDMIQFTAPTSHGSSGGAVLNMYGEVIGISTAGIDEGQNLNLAVGYKYIGSFVRGFV